MKTPEMKLGWLLVGVITMSSFVLPSVAFPMGADDCIEDEIHGCPYNVPDSGVVVEDPDPDDNLPNARGQCVRGGVNYCPVEVESYDENCVIQPSGESQCVNKAQPGWGALPNTGISLSDTVVLMVVAYLSILVGIVLYRLGLGAAEFSHNEG